MKLLKKISPFEILLILSILGVHLYASFADGYNFANLWFIRDDAYYYFKVAQNISEGMGSTFDGINITNGYHPLWMLVNIPIFALARYNLILPLRVLLMVIAGLQAATAVLIYRITARSLSKSVAILAACYWAFNGYIHFAYYRPGLETPLAAFAIVLFTERLSAFEFAWRKNAVTPKQISVLALFAVFVMFSRLDLVFLAVIAGIYIVFRGHPIRYLLPFDAVIIFLSMTGAVVLRAQFPDYNKFAAPAVFAVVVALAIKIITFYFMGLYQHPKRKTARELIRQVFTATAIGAGFTSTMMLLLMRVGIIQEFSRVALLYDWVISFGLILILRLAARRAASRKVNPNLSTPTPREELRANWKFWLKEGWLYYRIVGGALAVYMLYNKIFFGTYTPVSSQVKRWWGTLQHTVYDNPAGNWREFLGIGYGAPYDAWAPVSHAILFVAQKVKPLYPGADTQDERYYIVMGILFLLISIILLFNARRVSRMFTRMGVIPLIAGGGIHILAYTATSYGGAKEWYWVSQTLLAVFLFSVIFDLLLKPAQKFIPARRLLEAAAILYGAYMGYEMSSFIIRNMRHNVVPPNTPYMEVVAYLEENTPPHIVIGMTGGGNVGYFIKDRTITNMDGLINSYEYFQVLQAGEAPQYLHQRGMRVVFSNIRLLSFPPYDGQFTHYLTTYNMFGNKNLMWLLPESKKAK